MDMTMSDRRLPVVLILCRDRRTGRGLVLLAEDSGLDAVLAPSAADAVSVSGDGRLCLSDGRTAAALWADADDEPELIRLPDGCPAILWTEREVGPAPNAGKPDTRFPVLLHRPFDEELLLALTRVCLSRRDTRTAPEAVTQTLVPPEPTAPAAPLTPNEQKIFDCLCAHKGTPVTRAALRALIGEVPGAPGNMVDVYVSRLRSKLEKPAGTRMILTVRGVGYMMK